MHHFIDPMVDCVFKAIFGDPAHVRLLISLLNAVLKPTCPIVHVTIVNPFNEKDFEADKLTVVDVRAVDTSGAILHIEIQTANHKAMLERVLFVWADQYQAQLRQGQKWKTLRPVCSVWILREPVAALPKAWHHRFVAYDPEHEVVLSTHLELHLLQLGRWSAPDLPGDDEASRPALADLDGWMYFLKHGGTWRDVPPALATPELEEAMSILSGFSEKEEDYLRYKARLNRLRDIAQFQEDLAEAQEELAAAQQAAAAAQQEAAAAQQEAAAALSGQEAERAAKEAALAEARELRERLMAAGLLNA